MDDILTVAELIEELKQLPPEARVFLTVVKYPEEFGLKPTVEGEYRWDLGSDVECIPLERGEITLHDGLVYLTAELADYNEARRSLT